MRIALLVLSCALGCLLSLLPAPAAPPAENPPASTAKLLLLADDRPVLIGLDLEIDGKPVQAVFEEARAAFLDKLFTWLDRNNDGHLDPTEAVRLPMSLLSIPGLRPAELEAVHVAFNFDALDRDGNGKIAKQELGEFLSEFGLTPVSVTLDQPLQEVSATLQQQFFKVLDSNGDGKLSLKELEAAGRFVAKHDGDEDERLDIFEVVGGGRGEGELAPPLAMGGVRAPATPTGLLVLNPERESGDIGTRLMEHYQRLRKRGTDTGLNAKELELDAASFKRLDRNKDGVLDAAELDDLPELTPAFTLTARMGKRDARQALLSSAKVPTFVRLADTGSFRVATSVWLDGRCLTGQVDEGLLGSLLRSYKLEFEGADRNADGKLDAAEIKTSRLFTVTGDALDRNGDGRIEIKEVADWLDQIVTPLARVLMNRASIVVSQPGNGMWDLLDANRDGFLSERELRRAASLLKELDRNGDGQLQAEEIPNAYQVTIARGEATLSSRGQLVRLELASDGRLKYPSRQDIGGPTWFRKMDRNGDGDVSLKEFLGTPEQFRKLDRDSDGLISLEEAEAAVERSSSR